MASSTGLTTNGSAHARESDAGSIAGNTVGKSSGDAAGKTSDPSEVGWLFVPQYYLMLNQTPDRLHRFYTKKSTLVHGIEQEEASPCFGQQVS